VTKEMPRPKIDRTAIDALLYGIWRSLEYLGEQKRALLEKIEAETLQHLIDTGDIPSGARPVDRASSLRELLLENGYGPSLAKRTKGNQRTSVIPSLVDIMKPDENHMTVGRASGRGLVDKQKISWALYEAVLYGMTSALDDQLGAQAQLLLQRIGTGMLEYLIGVGAIENSDDLETLAQRVADYYVSAGYTRSFRGGLEGPNVWMSRYESAPYFPNVIRRLRNKGSALFSCPLCLTGQSVWINQGWRFGDVLELHISTGGDVTARSKVYPPAERFTERDARKLSQTKG